MILFYHCNRFLSTPVFNLYVSEFLRIVNSPNNTRADRDFLLPFFQKKPTQEFFTCISLDGIVFFVLQ